jgi:putative transcriptional regulator
MRSVCVCPDREAGSVHARGARAGALLQCARIAAILASIPLALAAASSLGADPQFEREAVLLAAAPGFHHPLWGRTVLLAAPLPLGGHFGVILNRPLENSLASLFPNHPPSRKVVDPVRFGGPFSTASVVALARRYGTPGKGAVPLGDELFFVYAADALDRLIEQAPNDARYFVGFVLWRPGELREEFDRGLWSLHRASAETVFRNDTERMWQELIDSARRLGTRASTLCAAGEGSGHAAACRSAITASRNRPASPPLTTRWSKVSESGSTRWTTGRPSSTTTRGAIRPAPRIATVGGTTIGAA